ncbi:MAG: 30S ribosomal protein S20 [Myxococcales bacterium]|nr:30S ribosomal protein S20 [Myxococcales bacterium]MCB9669335.1 30S ribosomal protein S20 [Alphaproteobacteria bacterium]MCB9690399.1 30S ribosomal protein S20 [Alphaproteobacteria bacterium]
MANHKDAIKRNKQNEKRRQANRHYRSVMRNQIKRVRAAVDSGDKSAASEELRKAVSVIQRVAGKRVIHKNQAARRCARLNAAVHAME